MSFEPSKRSGVWSFEDDASPLSRMVRRVKRDGPQYVSIEGLGEVVILSTDDFSRLKGGATCQLLPDAFAASRIATSSFRSNVDPCRCAMDRRDRSAARHGRVVGTATA